MAKKKKKSQLQKNRQAEAARRKKRRVTSDTPNETPEHPGRSEAPRSFKTPIAVAVLLVTLLLTTSFSILFASVFGNYNQESCEITSIHEGYVETADCGTLRVGKLPLRNIDVEAVEDALETGGYYNLDTYGIRIGPLLPTITKVSSVF